MYENVWKCMEMYGNVWICMEMYENATQEEIETYAEDRMQDILQEEEIFEDNFSFMGQKEGQEVLDVGDRYDEDPQGTENAGDGYVDDFVDIIIKNE